jgi:hypothetical protein
MRAKKIGAARLRSFGLIVAAGFAVVGWWPRVFRGQPPRSWALTVGLALFTLAVVFPTALKPFHRVWMAVGEALGWVNSRVILSVVYYALILPIGTIRRLRGHDPMRRKIDRDAATYRITRSGRPASHMQRQY